MPAIAPAFFESRFALKRSFTRSVQEAVPTQFVPRPLDETEHLAKPEGSAFATLLLVPITSKALR
jgi:hypothetical protein